jgi:hypothetical protein
MASLAFRVTGAFSAEELCCTSLDCTSTVHDLKKEIERYTKISATEQRLLLGKRVMRDRSYLEDLIVEDTLEPVEVSLVRINASENLARRLQAFENQYRYSCFGDSSDRWSFHHQRVSTRTNLNRGFGSKQLYVVLRQNAKRTVTFNLCSLDFPLRELFDTFAAQENVLI